ncbi:MAG: alpha/beta hydrolase-fold protein [Bacteroidota bacterium]
MRNAFLLFLLLSTLSACQQTGQESSVRRSFAVRLPAELADQTLDGRLLLLLSKDDSREPRFQVNDNPGSQLVFGLDVLGWSGSKEQSLSDDAFGYPIHQLKDVPAGEYYVQGLLHLYETFTRSDGHTVKLPMDRGEGQHWNLAPGNLYSQVQKIVLKEGQDQKIDLVLDQKIPPIEPPKDSKYIKHVRIQSELLSKFWGRPMYLGAHVLLPEGYDEYPDRRYPLAIMHGHFPSDFNGFRTDPPDPNLKPEYSDRFQMEGYNRVVQQEAYDFYKTWTGPDFPRVLAIKIQHANPFYDDSYAVNSANLGPYGDAITYELIPYIEKQFRGVGKGEARFLYGGSTGGWEALAAQVFYPDEYNGCFAACPDPIDFRAYMLLDIYKDKNAYFIEGDFRRIERPARRDYLGQVTASMYSMNMRELALGNRNRSGDQFDIWEAVYSPVGEDGYPKRLWDKRTGVIDPEVAEYWKENYDLSYILKRDWKTLGPKLKGKIHIYCGDMDNYYLNNAVYLMEDFLQTTEYDGEVDYGDRAEHCWNGDHAQPNAISRLRYHRMFIPKWYKERWQRR